jgi:hypothetical protein
MNLLLNIEEGVSEPSYINGNNQCVRVAERLKLYPARIESAGKKRPPVRNRGMTCIRIIGTG